MPRKGTKKGGRLNASAPTRNVDYVGANEGYRGLFALSQIRLGHV